MIRRYEPIYLAKYAHYNDLIYRPGWKHLRLYVKNTKNINLLLKSAKDKKLRNTVKIKFGVNIPCDYKEEMMFGADNENTNWKDADLL